MVVENKHTQKIKSMIKSEVTHMFEQALDFVQVACPEPHFKPLRSKILRVGNNCIRSIHKELDEHYDVLYRASSEDIIEIQQKK